MGSVRREGTRNGVVHTVLGKQYEYGMYGCESKAKSGKEKVKERKV